MSAEKQEPSAMTHTPLKNVPIKTGLRSAIKPLSLTPDPGDSDPDARLLNIIIRRTEHNRLKDKNTELEEQFRAISTSYAILGQDVKEVEALNQNLEKRIKVLEEWIKVERSNGLEYARREVQLISENQRLKGLLSQMRGSVSGDNDLVMNEGRD